MLLANNRGPFGFQGLAGSADVQNLQGALVSLAQATQQPSINPGGTPSGVMDDGTMNGLAAAMPMISASLPSWLYIAMQTAMLFGPTSAQAKDFATSYATQLITACNAAALQYKVNPGTPVPLLPAAPGFLNFGAGWYKQPWGLLLIAVGLFGFYKFFIADKKPSA